MVSPTSDPICCLKPNVVKYPSYFIGICQAFWGIFIYAILQYSISDIPECFKAAFLLMNFLLIICFFRGVKKNDYKLMKPFVIHQGLQLFFLSCLMVFALTSFIYPYSTSGQYISKIYSSSDYTLNSGVITARAMSFLVFSGISSLLQMFALYVVYKCYIHISVHCQHVASCPEEEPSRIYPNPRWTIGDDEIERMA